MTAAIQAPRRRWFLRYSLRTGLVGVTLVCVLLGLLVSPAARQQAAIQQLQEDGRTRIHYDYERIEIEDSDGNDPVANSVVYSRFAYAKDWLAQTIGEEWMCRPEFVELNVGGWRRVNGIPLLRDLPSVSAVHISADRLSAHDIEGLKHMPNLSELAIGPVNWRYPVVLPPLREIQHVRRLILNGMCDDLKAVLPAGITHLSLYLHQPYTKREFDALARLPNLQFLALRFDSLDGVDLSLLAALNQVPELELECEIQIEQVAQMRQSDSGKLRRLKARVIREPFLFKDFAREAQAFLPGWTIEESYAWRAGRCLP